MSFNQTIRVNTKTRDLKFFLKPDDNQHNILIECDKKYRRLMKKISTIIYNGYVDGSISLAEILDKSKKYRPPNTIALFDKIRIERADIFDEEGIYGSGQRRMLTQIIQRGYKGYYKRNSSKDKGVFASKKIVLRQNKAIQYKSVKHNVDDSVIILPVYGSNGKEVKRKDSIHLQPNTLNIKYDMPKSLRRFLPYIGNDIGGNLERYRRYNKDMWIYHTKYTMPIEWKYEPISALGMDMNKDRSCSVVFSENVDLDCCNGNILIFDDNVFRLQDIISNIVNEIGERKTLRTKARGRLRRKWQKLHKKHEKLINTYAQRILDYVEEKKMLLCIDGASPGAGCGEFGQLLGKMLRSGAEDRCIPFVYVGSAYTSQDCSLCGHRDKSNLDRKTNIFSCKNCGYTCSSHDNAANIIKKRGWEAWNITSTQQEVENICSDVIQNVEV